MSFQTVDFQARCLAVPAKRTNDTFKGVNAPCMPPAKYGHETIAITQFVPFVATRLALFDCRKVDLIKIYQDHKVQSLTDVLSNI